MARLHEYQGKSILRASGIAVPRGSVARSPEDAAKAFAALGGAGGAMVKVQAWTTGRAAAGGIAKVASGAEASDAARRMLAMTFSRFPVTEVLVEERISIARELFVSLAIDERERSPVLLLSASGGSGVEERAGEARRIACDVNAGPESRSLDSAVGSFGLPANAVGDVTDVVRKVFEIARKNDARSIEINPLAITAEGKVVAADCRMTIDDYAVVRHPELGIEIARELDHPPTSLERIAYDVEQADHRGTFFFAQMNTAAPATSKGLIGFHGAGGGGSMMSMDAVTTEGFTVANFCDTSGNPSPAKVYRASRIILEQPGLVGYFGSGSGVANQEQYWSAYGLAKAFWELELSIPAVIRLGGNTEERAIDILQSACKGLLATVEGYTKNDPPAKIARRFAELVAEHRSRAAHADGSVGWVPRPPRRPAFVSMPGAIRFALKGGEVVIDPGVWTEKSAAIIARSGGLLRNEGGKPMLAVTPQEFMNKDSEMIACEVECRRDGFGGVFVVLEIPGLNGKAGC